MVTFSLFTYQSSWSKFLALSMMGLARPFLFFRKGLVFWKLVGCGAGIGFSLKPDYGRYGLMAVWESNEAFDKFLNSTLYAIYKKLSSEQYHLKLATIQSKGAWSGVNPFENIHNANLKPSPIVVLTRATIRLSKIRDFWNHVPIVSESLLDAKGLIASIGIGEVPVFKQATLSIWKDLESVKEYAYKMEQHKDVVVKTRTRNWYKEELFARFAVVDSWGTWNGENPLKSH
ncbi:hypothetical protein RCC89_11530 [Cytophagaceae bacterium ABcell3]|nr:hypothetical protein RCC89_11530 [Cytophagaceae bacterium ABcell3]